MPEADLQRVVETKFMLRDELSAKLGTIVDSLHKLHKSEDEAKKKTEELGKKFKEMADQAGESRERFVEFAAAAGVALGGAELAKKFIEVNSEAENLQRTMGALVSANYQYAVSGKNLSPAENFKESMRTGKEMYEEFDKAAMAYGLSTSSLSEASSMLMPGFAKAKVGTKEASEQITKLGIISRSAGKDLGATSMALEMFLTTGMAMKRNPVMQMLGLSNMEKASGAQRFEALQKGLARFDEQSLKGTTTFSDRMNMIKARIDNIYEIGGKPVFEAANKAAEELVGWMEKNKDSLHETARELGESFVPMLKYGAKAIEFGAEHAVALKNAFVAIAMAKGAYTLFDKLNEFAENSGKMEGGLASLAKMDVGKALGTPIGAAASSVMILSAAAIGYAIGTEINKYIGKDVQNLTDKTVGNGKMGAKDVGWRALAAGSTMGLSELYFGAAKAYDKFSGAEHNREIGDAADRKLASIYAARPDLKPAAYGGYGPRTQEGEVTTERAKTQRGDVIFNDARFDIHQQFAPGFDPDRIAVALAGGIAKLGERRIQSSLIAPFGVR